MLDSTLQLRCTDKTVMSELIETLSLYSRFLTKYIIAFSITSHHRLITTSVTHFQIQNTVHSTPEIWILHPWLQTDAHTVLLSVSFGWVITQRSHPNSNGGRRCFEQKRRSSVPEFVLYSLWHDLPPCLLDNRQTAGTSGRGSLIAVCM